MRTISASSLFLVSAALLAAQDAPWLTKPTTQWDESDARQVLTSVSPWAKITTATVVRQLTEDQEREAGRMGGNKDLSIGDVLVPTTLFGGKQQSRHSMGERIPDPRGGSEAGRPRRPWRVLRNYGVRSPYHNCRPGHEECRAQSETARCTEASGTKGY